MNPAAFSLVKFRFECLRDQRIRGLGLIFLLLASYPAGADWHGQISVLSDYLYRGYSKNRGNPLVQGQLEYEHDAGWFAGLGLSRVSFDDRSERDHANLEIKPYLGWTLPLMAGWKAELQVVGYVYDDKVFGRDADYVEFYASLHYLDGFTGRFSAAPDAYQRDVATFDYELIYRRDIMDSLQFSAGLGYYQAKQLLELEDDYFYWNAGVSWFMTPNLNLDLRYVDVNLDQRPYASADGEEFYPRLLEHKYLLSLTLGF